MAEKKVNYGVQGIEDLVSDLNNSKDQNGEGQNGAIAIPSRKATGRPAVRKKGTARTSITLDPEVMGKLRCLALNTGRQLNGIIEEAWSSISRVMRGSTARSPCLRFTVIHNK